MEEYNIDDYKYDYESEHPAVCVGTEKFNVWLDLSLFQDYDEFIGVCDQIFGDKYIETLDHENLIIRYSTEDMIDEDTFDKIIALFDASKELSEGELKAFDAFYDIFGENSVNHFWDSYQGKWDDEEDFAYHIVWDLGGVERNDWLDNYIDYKKLANDLFAYDYVFVDGYVFGSY